MPLSSRLRFGDSLMLVWQIDETEQELLRFVTDEDRLSIEGVTSTSRRVERLAWRAALRSELPEVRVSYDCQGAPELSNGLYVSVSHCDRLAVVLLSPGRCGVDVERADRDLRRVSGRFISAHERALNVAGDPFFDVTIWCAKEAMYKYYGQRGLDFLSDITIESTDALRGVLRGRIKSGEPLDIGIVRFGDCVVAYVIGLGAGFE